MPLVFVQRYAPAAAIAAGTGTQYVSGTLTLGNPTIVEVDPTVFTTAGTYTIFTYTTLVGSVSNLQAAAPGLNPPDLTGTGFTSASFSDTGSSITLTLS